MLNYADNIKKMRKRKKYTQSELAKGITSQGMISKVEKKQLSPDIELLQAIAEKLDCTLMELLFNDEEKDLNQIYSYMNSLVSRREYSLLEVFFKTDQSIEKIKKENEGYYKWINGVILTQNHNNFNEGVDELIEALQLTLDDQLKVRILVGLSGLYSEIEQYDNSLKYLLEAAALSDTAKIDNKLKQKINFQLARLYSVLEEFHDSIFYNQIAIQFATEKDNLYLLDDLYLLLSDSYLRINKLKEAKENVEIANTIAKVRANSKLFPYIERTNIKIEKKLYSRKK